MLNRHQKNLSDKKTDKGFTLVELLVVVVILVVLAVVAVPMFLNQKDKANEARAQMDVAAAAGIMQTGKGANYFVTPVLTVNGATLTLTTDDPTNITPEVNPAELTVTAPDPGEINFMVDAENHISTFCVSSTTPGLEYYQDETMSTPHTGTCP